MGKRKSGESDHVQEQCDVWLTAQGRQKTTHKKQRVLSLHPVNIIGSYSSLTFDTSSSSSAKKTKQSKLMTYFKTKSAMVPPQMSDYQKENVHNPYHQDKRTDENLLDQEQDIPDGTPARSPARQSSEKSTTNNESVLVQIKNPRGSNQMLQSSRHTEVSNNDATEPDDNGSNIDDTEDESLSLEQINWSDPLSNSTIGFDSQFSAPDIPHSKLDFSEASNCVQKSDHLWKKNTNRSFLGSDELSDDLNYLSQNSLTDITEPTNKGNASRTKPNTKHLEPNHRGPLTDKTSTDSEEKKFLASTELKFLSSTRRNSFPKYQDSELPMSLDSEVNDSWKFTASSSDECSSMLDIDSEILKVQFHPSSSRFTSTQKPLRHSCEDTDPSPVKFTEDFSETSPYTAIDDSVSNVMGFKEPPSPDDLQVGNDDSESHLDTDDIHEFVDIDHGRLHMPDDDSDDECSQDVDSILTPQFTQDSIGAYRMKKLII